MSASNATNVAFVYKKLYSERAVGDLAMRRHAFFAMLAKEDGFTGSGMFYDIRYGNPQGIGGSFSVVKTVSETANQGHSFGKQLLATRKKKYGRITIDGEALAAASNDKGAFLRLVQMETDGVLEEHGDTIAFELTRDGTSQRGRVNAAYAGGNTITLATADDARNFKVGMVIIADNAADGLTPRTGETYVTAVDEDAGTVTVDDATDITGVLAANDYLFRKSEPGTAIEGLALHFPLTAPGGGDSFRGISRGADPRRLAGVRVNDTATAIEENAGLVAVKIGQVGKKADHLWLNPINFWQVAKRLNAKIEYSGGGGTATYAFETFKIASPAGTLTCMSDADFPVSYGYVTNMKSLYLKTLKTVPHIIMDDGMKSLRITDDDGIEARTRSMCDLICTEPGANGVFAI